MSNLNEKITVANNKQHTAVSIPNDSKAQFRKGETIRLYDNTYTASSGNHYSIAPNCIIKSKNRKLYTVTVSEIKNNSGKTVSSRITVDYLVPKDNVLPNNTGDRAIIDFKEVGLAARKSKISRFFVDTSFAEVHGGSRDVIVTGDLGVAFSLVAKNEDGLIIKELKNLKIPKPSAGKTYGELATSIEIPTVASSTFYTVELEVDNNVVVGDNVALLHTINQYSTIDISISSTTATALVVSGTTPVVLSGIEVGESLQSVTANWVVTKGSGVKIYAHRQPHLSQTIAYNTSGSSDYTNTLTSANGNTIMSLQPTVVQTNNTTITMVLAHATTNIGVSSVSPVLNLDNFIKVAPPAFDLSVRASIGGTSVKCNLNSIQNVIPISAAFITGGWSTVSAPIDGSLGSYGAYNGSTPGLVMYTPLTIEEWEDKYGATEPNERPEFDFFTYKLNDGTTDSATHTVTITYAFTP